MINLFRETYSSIQDNYYGRVIIDKSLRSVVWYWTKYLLILSAIMVLFVVFFMTNRLPQLPKFIQSSVPDGRYELKDGIFSTSINQPYKAGNSEFSFLIDTTATSSALNEYHSGILISRRDLILKSSDGTITTQNMSNFPSFTFSPSELATFISQNFIEVWAACLIGILGISMLIGLLFWMQKIISFVIWSLIILLVAKFTIKKDISFINTLKLVIYASVLPLLLSFVLSSIPNPIIDILGLGIMAYFTFNWIRHLDLPVSEHITISKTKNKSSKKPS